jgi:hypothetical protein
LLTNNNINNYIKTVNCSRIKHIAQKVDYYRAKILYTHGGIWIDIDTILLSDISYLFDILKISDKEVMLSMSEIKSIIPNVCIAHLYSKKNSIIMKLWYIECEEIINSKKFIKWSDLGGPLLANIIIKNNLYDTIMRFPDEIVFRIGYKNYENFYNVDKLIVDKYFDDIINNNKKIIILYGTFMYNIDIVQNSLLGELVK